MSQNTKLWLAVLLLIAAGGIVWWQWNAGSTLPQNITFVCVETGERFNIDRDSIAVVPAENPSTGRNTLLPAMVDEDGTVRVSNRARGTLKMLGELNQCVDMETLIVREEP